MENKPKINIAWIVLSLLAVVLFSYLFRNTFVWLYGRWTGVDSYYSHGFLIPFISLGLYWIYGRKKAATVQPQSQWVPVWGMIASILLHLTGMLLTVYFLSGLAMILFVCFAGWYLLGGAVFRRRWFPFFFLFMMLPLPSLVLEKVTFPMKMFVSKISVVILDILKIPYIHKGFEIEMAGGSMIIDNPCSGLRSFIAFLAMALILAYITKFGKWRSAVLLAATVPVALLCNILRVQFLLLVAHYQGVRYTLPGTPAHDYSGLVMFALGMGIFLLAAQRMSKWEHTES